MLSFKFYKRGKKSFHVISITNMKILKIFNRFLGGQGGNKIFNLMSKILLSTLSVDNGT